MPAPAAVRLAAATGDPREKARKELPGLIASFTDVSEEECPVEQIDFLDERLGATGAGELIADDQRE